MNFDFDAIFGRKNFVFDKKKNKETKIVKDLHQRQENITKNNSFIFRKRYHTPNRQSKYI